MVDVTHNGAPVSPTVAKEVLGAVRDLVDHSAFQQLIANATGMAGPKAEAALASVKGAINEAELHLSAPKAGGRHNDRRSLRMMAMAGAPDAPQPATTPRHDHLALDTPKSNGRPTAPVV